MDYLDKKKSAVFVNESSELVSCCTRWKKATVLAMDTEFIRTNTFYPIPALLQVYDGEHCTLIDPVMIQDLSPLADILLDPAIVKVLHSCSEDLEVFDQLFKCLPKPLFDTQIAAALLGYGFSVGYARLIKTLLNVDIPKDETRSDWLQRPLSQTQLDYATLDVIYLYHLYEKFSLELRQQDKLSWAEACNEEMISQFRTNQDPTSYFSRFKNLWKLDPEQQQRLYRLSLWRENTARQRNKPRNHILRDEALLEISQRNPGSREDLAHLKTLPAAVLKYHARDLLAILASPSAQALPASQGPLPKEVGPLLNQLQECAETTAQRLNIAPEMLLRKKDLHQLVASHLAGVARLPASLEGWRRPIIGDILMQLTETWPTTKPA